jgi:NAD(P)-dependent dehydrogenase (short-subunit alcohol dehydrogenase family)
MPNNKHVALVTGANQGIGLQIAKDLAAKGLTVLAGSRDVAKGQAAARDIGGHAHAVQLDVTDQRSIDAAAARIESEFGHIDILINNAAISKIGQPKGPVEEIAKSGHISVVKLEDIRTLYDTNVFGVIAVTQAMLPLLRKSKSARIVNVSSGVGSLTRTLGPGGEHLRQIFGMYSASKTALNAITVGLALDLEKEGITVHAVCPGFTKTALNNFQGTKTVEEGAREPVRVALAEPALPTASYTGSEGPFPW